MPKKSQAEEEYDKVMRILMRNSDKQFVHRILLPKAYPQLDEPDGRKATHKMGWVEENGKYHVYPSILYDGAKLTDYGNNAWPHAKKVNDYITFDTPDEADWFSKNYKQAWIK